ncbi:major head protein [Pseudoalteromonas phage PH1]|uniref:major head protein n=1 Tax=Pseudoalteromonas phage PH1 TaxID=1874540 RepID=UPI00081982D5|nr:major head protein [Pseudoalteromonas phage PH1]ANY29553.1 hypothetical protein [Pseudoalteromonas phage PH1]
MATGVVDINSDLVRKKWMREGLIQGASTSFWSPMTGSNRNAIVYQENNENSGSGHTVVFDFDGNLTGKGIKGKDTARGKGEQKKKFSDKITVERYRLVVDNGDKFDGVNIGDLSINEHSDSRKGLADLFVRFKDQSIFDAAQGNLITNEDGKQAPSHSIDLGSTFNFNTLLDIEKTLKTSQGFTTGGVRRPLVPYRTDGNRPMWLYVIDSAMANILRKDTAGYQALIAQGDVRGNNNRNINGVIGRLGQLVIVEADQFFGETAGTATSGWGMNDSEIELSGLRQYDATNDAWTGQDGFEYTTSNLKSRGLILGAGALQLAFGKMPDYKYKSSDDFDITSESAMEFWMEARKTHLKAENAEYKQAKVANIDHGVVVTDLKVS